MPFLNMRILLTGPRICFPDWLYTPGALACSMNRNHYNLYILCLHDKETKNVKCSDDDVTWLKDGCVDILTLLLCTRAEPTSSSHCRCRCWSNGVLRVTTVPTDPLSVAPPKVSERHLSSSSVVVISAVAAGVVVVFNSRSRRRRRSVNSSSSSSSSDSAAVVRWWWREWCGVACCRDVAVAAAVVVALAVVVAVSETGTSPTTHAAAIESHDRPSPSSRLSARMSASAAAAAEDALLWLRRRWWRCEGEADDDGRYLTAVAALVGDARPNLSMMLIQLMSGWLSDDRFMLQYTPYTDNKDVYDHQPLPLQLKQLQLRLQMLLQPPLPFCLWIKLLIYYY